MLNAGTAIEDLTDISISLTRGTIDVTNNDSAGWRQLLAAPNKGGTITATAYVDFSATEGFDEIITEFQNDTAVIWKIQTDVTTESISGTGLCTDVTYSGSTEEAVKYDFTIELTGAITFGAGL